MSLLHYMSYYYLLHFAGLKCIWQNLSLCEILDNWKLVEILLHWFNNDSQMQSLFHQAYTKHNPYKKVFHYCTTDIK